MTAWAVNVAGVGALVRAARAHRFTLVHVSSDYVFDGTDEVHPRGRAVLPARGLRPDQGRRRCAGRLADPPLHPAHQLGGRRRPQLRAHHGRAGRRGECSRPSSTTSTAGSPSPPSWPGRSGTCSRSGAPFGTYNVSNSGPTQTWADIAAEVFGRLRAGPDRRVSGQHGGIRRRPADLAPRPAAQHAEPGQDHRHGVSADGVSAGIAALSGGSGLAPPVEPGPSGRRRPAAPRLRPRRRTRRGAPARSIS